MEFQKRILPERRNGLLAAVAADPMGVVTALAVGDAADLLDVALLVDQVLKGADDRLGAVGPRLGVAGGRLEHIELLVDVEEGLVVRIGALAVAHEEDEG